MHSELDRPVPCSSGYRLSGEKKIMKLGGLNYVASRQLYRFQVTDFGSDPVFVNGLTRNRI